MHFFKNVEQKLSKKKSDRFVQQQKNIMEENDLLLLSPFLSAIETFWYLKNDLRERAHTSVFDDPN